MNPFELFEMRELTAARVEAWLKKTGWVEVGSFAGQKRFTRQRGDQVDSVGLAPHQVFVGAAENLQTGLLLLAEQEGRTLQGLLQEMNPVFRRCSPSAAARAAHLELGGMWFYRCRIAVGGDDGAEPLMSPAIILHLRADVQPETVEQDTRAAAEYWPATRNAYRCAWPTDGEGKEL